MSGGAKYAIIGGAVAVAIIAGVAGYLAVPTADMAEEPAVQEPETLTIYSGRSESLIGPLIEQFEEDTGIDAEVRYGKTAGLALAIIEEGENSPADIYFAQDAGALGALSKEGRLLAIPDSILQEVDDAFQSTEGEWVGITGRARVVDYNTNLVDKSELPASIWGFLDPEWKGKIGWAPPNGSFQSFVTALRVVEGEDRAREWLLGIMANEPVAYSGNTPTVEGIARGEVHVGFVNNYYLQRFLAEDPQFPVAHHYTDGDAGSMINVAGVGIVDTTQNRALAERFIEYMLSDEAQSFFATTTYEYPLAGDVAVVGPQSRLADISIPDIDLSDLDDLEGTLDLLREVNAL